MNKRFRLTDETIRCYGCTLHRIEALVDMPKHKVKAGDLGGYVEKEENLKDDAWVFGEAKVFEMQRLVAMQRFMTKYMSTIMRRFMVTLRFTEML